MQLKGRDRQLCSSLSHHDCVPLVHGVHGRERNMRRAAIREYTRVWLASQREVLKVALSEVQAALPRRDEGETRTSFIMAQQVRGRGRIG